MNKNHVTMNMSMTLAWQVQCSFIFQSWSTENVFPFIVGCILSGIVAAMTIALPSFKHKFISSQRQESNSLLTEANMENVKENIVLKIVYYFIYSTLHMATMLLIMTMNGYVILVMILGMIISFVIFGSADNDHNKPVNCCSSAP